MQNTLYIKTPVSTPPDKAGWFMCFNGQSEFAGLAYYNGFKFDHSYVSYWLRPISESELAIEFRKWLSENYEL